MFNVVPAAFFFFLAGVLMLAYKIDSTMLRTIEAELQEEADSSRVVIVCLSYSELHWRILCDYDGSPRVVHLLR